MQAACPALSSIQYQINELHHSGIRPKGETGGETDETALNCPDYHSFMPANIPHAVNARQRFKMLLTMIRG